MWRLSRADTEISLAGLAPGRHAFCVAVFRCRCLGLVGRFVGHPSPDICMKWPPQVAMTSLYDFNTTLLGVGAGLLVKLQKRLVFSLPILVHSRPRVAVPVADTSHLQHRWLGNRFFCWSAPEKNSW